MAALDRWDSFYVIVGSAAGALIGLQFVVMTLIAQRPPIRAAEGGAAFSTPTVVHFSTVLFLAAVLRAPWDANVPAIIVIAAVGAAGTMYALVTARRMRRQTVYTPDSEDWLFHAIIPFSAYLLLLLSALACVPRLRDGLFGVVGGTLLLLFCAIHNAWDATAYHVLAQRRQGTKAGEDAT
jgi:hypothetical protein